MAANFDMTASELRESGAHGVVGRLDSQPDSGEKYCLILVDQFEELLTLCEDEQDRKASEQEKEHGERHEADSARDRHSNMYGRGRRPGSAEPKPGNGTQQDPRDLED